ncbi:MAG: chorismate lyase [Rhodocyclaceae bacterium]|nr:chorismate lyase [Rhodocyclaceae bacterium]MDP1957138.1 chorismate lyase [Rhodocyclaceae bacterium]
MSRQDFRWKAHPALAGAPTVLHPWLIDSGSLTARIVARCNKFQVRVLGEQRARPFSDERQLIGLPAGRHAWVREVLLIADGIPVVFAHSVLAPRDLRGAWHMARAIGSRPLGAALFADPGILRGPLTAARLTTAHPLHRHACAALGKMLPTLWARRSRFCRLDRPLLVTEVFLPGIARLY